MLTLPKSETNIMKVKVIYYLLNYHNNASAFLSQLARTCFLKFDTTAMEAITIEALRPGV